LGVLGKWKVLSYVTELLETAPGRRLLMRIPGESCPDRH